MKIHVLPLMIACLAWSLVDCRGDETTEPPQRLTLIVDGKSYPFQMGDEIKLSGDFSNPTIRLIPSPTRTFAYGGIRFEYPAKYTWEAEIEGTGYRSWVLSGNDCKIMYFVMTAELSPESYAESMKEQFGAANTKTRPITKQFGKLKLEGRRVIASVADNAVTQDAFIIPGPAQGSRLLVLQDVPSQEAPESKEAKQVLKLLSESLRVTKDQ